MWRSFLLLMLSFLVPMVSANAQPPAVEVDKTAVEFSRVLQTIADSETVQELFNGKDLTGWQGNPELWSVADGVIRATNDDHIATSTYLFTEKKYRNFRLLLEVKATVGGRYTTRHSAVAILGKQVVEKRDGNPFGFEGPLMLLCDGDWGIWDYKRQRVLDAELGPQVEKKGDWNLIEILVIGNRIRFACNGVELFDFTDKPEMLRESPIGLQLHSASKPQEYHFRGLVLTQDPEDHLVSLVPQTGQSTKPD